jgi:hypothetical protein
MGVKQEGIFKMHDEDKDELLPLCFMALRHEQPPMDAHIANIINWRLKERVSLWL